MVEPPCKSPIPTPSPSPTPLTPKTNYSTFSSLYRRGQFLPFCEKKWANNMNKGTFLSLYIYKELNSPYFEFKKKSHQISPLGTHAANSTLVLSHMVSPKFNSHVYNKPKRGCQREPCQNTFYFWEKSKLRPSML
jgi:hypothetical protein